MSKINKKNIKMFLGINIGVFLAAIAFTVFLSPAYITGSGLSGLAIVCEQFLPSYLSKSGFILILNIILLALSYFTLGKEYFFKTAYGALTYPLYQMLVEFIVKNTNSDFFAFDLNNDMYLIVIFGAILMGFGIGLTLRNGGSTGGGDIVQSIMFKYFNVPFSRTMYVIDGTLVLLSILVFQDLSLSLASIIYILLTGIIVDNVVFGGFNKRAVYIISEHNDEIRKIIMEQLVRGTTNLMAYGGYNKAERDVILCVLSTSEYFDLRNMVEKIDPHAFMFVTKSTEVRGYGFSLESEARLNRKKKVIIDEKK